MSRRGLSPPRCPNCGGKMMYSDTAVLLDADGTQAEPPLWLCHRCWRVLPLKGQLLKTTGGRGGAGRSKP